MSSKEKNVLVSRAEIHDAKFLAAIDGLAFPHDGKSYEELLEQRKQLWNARLSQAEPPEVYVAKENGALYAGYLIILKYNEQPVPEVVVGPKFEVEHIARPLMEKAGLTYEPLPA